MADSNEPKTEAKNAGIYRPRGKMEVKSVLDLRRFVPKPTARRRKRLKNPTPLGRALKNYAILYHTDWRAIAQLMAKIDPNCCADVTAEMVRDWVEFGTMPDAYQIQTICYILGIRNMWSIRPKAPKRKRPDMNADVRDWVYLDIMGDGKDAPKLETEADTCKVVAQPTDKTKE